MKLSMRLVLLGFAIGVLAAGTAAAVAQDKQDPAPVITPDGTEVLPLPVTDEQAADATAVPGDPGAEPFMGGNLVGDSPDNPQEVSSCRKQLAAGVAAANEPSMRMCEVIVAHADGELEPGVYSDSELDDALAATEVTR